MGAAAAPGAAAVAAAMIFRICWLLSGLTTFASVSQTPLTLPATLTSDVSVAVATLQRGGLVALPTETVYGLGANALDERAVAGIFAAKERPAFDPLIIHQSTAARTLAYAAEVPADARRLADHFWPGPLTLVLPKGERVPDLVTAGLPTVALRVPAHPVARAVLAAVDFPVAAPSANPFGFVSPTRPEHVLAQLGDRIDLVLDGGPCAVGLESTIVSFTDGRATVLRKGGLPVEDLAGFLGYAPTVRTHSDSRPEAPGMLSRHYSPGNRLEIFPQLTAATPAPPRSAWITFGPWNTDGRIAVPPTVTLFSLSPDGDLAEAAQQLFGLLRLMAERAYDYVAVQALPERGLGRAINDRLRRAAVPPKP